jgi:hypothetical protein
MVVSNLSNCDEGRGTNSNEERGILRLPNEERGSTAGITSTRNEGQTTLVDFPVAFYSSAVILVPR